MRFSENTNGAFADHNRIHAADVLHGYVQDTFPFREFFLFFFGELGSNLFLSLFCLVVSFFYGFCLVFSAFTICHPSPYPGSCKWPGKKRSPRPKPPPRPLRSPCPTWKWTLKTLTATTISTASWDAICHRWNWWRFTPLRPCTTTIIPDGRMHSSSPPMLPRLWLVHLSSEKNKNLRHFLKKFHESFFFEIFFTMDFSQWFFLPWFFLLDFFSLWPFSLWFFLLDFFHYGFFFWIFFFTMVSFHHGFFFWIFFIMVFSSGFFFSLWFFSIWIFSSWFFSRRLMFFFGVICRPFSTTTDPSWKIIMPRKRGGCCCRGRNSIGCVTWKSRSSNGSVIWWSRPFSPRIWSVILKLSPNSIPR